MEVFLIVAFLVALLLPAPLAFIGALACLNPERWNTLMHMSYPQFALHLAKALALGCSLFAIFAFLIVTVMPLLAPATSAAIGVGPLFALGIATYYLPETLVVSSLAMMLIPFIDDGLRLRPWQRNLIGLTSALAIGFAFRGIGIKPLTFLATVAFVAPPVLFALMTVFRQESRGLAWRSLCVAQILAWLLCSRYVDEHLGKRKVEAAKRYVEAMAPALNAHRKNFGRYPETADFLASPPCPELVRLERRLYSRDTSTFYVEFSDYSGPGLRHCYDGATGEWSTSYLD